MPEFPFCPPISTPLVDQTAYLGKVLAQFLLHCAASRALFQCFVKLRPGEGRIGAEDYFLALLLLALDFGQQQFRPALGAGNVAGPQFGGEAAAFTIEQQQRMITGGLEVGLCKALCSCWP